MSVLFHELNGHLVLAYIFKYYELIYKLLNVKVSIISHEDQYYKYHNLMYCFTSIEFICIGRNLYVLNLYVLEEIFLKMSEELRNLFSEMNRAFPL